MENNRRSGSLGAFLSGIFVATAVGGYMLFGSKNSRKNRQKVEDWVEDARAEVVSRVRRLKRLSREKYYEIADAVADKYAKLKEVGKEKADELRDELKSKWEEMEEEAKREEEEDK